MWRCSWLLIAGLAAILPAHADADADTAYVSNWKNNTICVIDTDKLQVVKTIEVGQRPRGILVTDDKKHLPVIDVASLEVVKTIQVGEQPSAVFIAAP
jgi:YVTN family beta-propeller protein